MQIGTLLQQVAAVGQGVVIANEGAMIGISPGTYQAGGTDTPARTVTVEEGFLTPQGEITNEQVDAVYAAYPRVRRGLFMEDTKEGTTRGYFYLLATGGARTPVDRFETIDPRLLPPSLGIARGQSLKDFLRQRSGILGGRFKIYTKAGEIRGIVPAPDRYRKLWIGQSNLQEPTMTRDDMERFQDPKVAATMIDYWQWQAIAQLLGGRGLLQQLFGLSGIRYVDLPNQAQWGLLAMEGHLEFMTKTGRLKDEEGKLLKAFSRRYIVPATDYPALSNGILPNTVWNWTKDRKSGPGGFYITRGSSWAEQSTDHYVRVGNTSLAAGTDSDGYYFDGGTLGARVVVSL